MSNVKIWSDVFGRSSVARNVFTVRPEIENNVGDLLKTYQLPSVVSGGMYEPITQGVAFLDGGLHWIDSYGYGMYTLQSGRRVLGWKALRFLCHELNVVPPRRPLGGEPPIVETAELVASFSGMRSDDPAGQSRAEAIASIKTGAHLRVVCRSLFGEEVLLSG